MIRLAGASSDELEAGKTKEAGCPESGQASSARSLDASPYEAPAALAISCDGSPLNQGAYLAPSIDPAGRGTFLQKS
jgi:hypothetical protein